MKGLEGLNSALEQLGKLRDELTKDLSIGDKKLYSEFNSEYARLMKEGNYKAANDLSNNFKKRINDRI